jgi:hypothetical protein
VTVHCTGYVAGDPPKKFWSTHDTNSPFSFNIGLGKVIKFVPPFSLLQRSLPTVIAGSLST